MAVRAQPEKGRANAEVEELLAGLFGLSKRQAAVVQGQTSRQKRVLILGVDANTVMAKIGQLK